MAKTITDKEHYCAAHQGNGSHYDPKNCTVCQLQDVAPTGILGEAIDIVRVRREEYKHPRIDFQCTADMWSAILTRHNGVPVVVTPELFSIMMAAMKLSRLVSNPTHRDSVVDVAGYMACLEDLGD